MIRTKSSEIDEKLLDKIICTAYGDANLWDRLQVIRMSKKNNEVKKLLEDYKKTASEVRSLEDETCPRELLAKVENETSRINKTNSFSADLVSLFAARPIVYSALAAVVAGFILFGIFFSRVPESRFTKAEIELADKQAKHALAIVGKIFAETNSTLRNEVLNSRVAKPIRESIGIVNELLNKGEMR